MDFRDRTNSEQKSVLAGRARPGGQMAMTEYETQARATRAKTARLKALRLAGSAGADRRGTRQPTKRRTAPRNK